MKRWKRYGQIVTCICSCILALVGLSQLTFGAYYIAKLPLFKVGSPVWIGFLNIILATGLFALQNRKFRQQYLCYWNQRDPNGTSGFAAAVGELKIFSKYQTNWKLYSSLCCSLAVVCLNAANAIICEAGEWNRWMSPAERELLKQGPLLDLAIQAHRITTAQTTVAILTGLFVSAFSVWLLRRTKELNIEDKLNNVISNDATSSTSKKTTPSHISFDNPNWVYGEDGAGNVESDPSPRSAAQDKTPPSVANRTPSTVRHATIRRAPSILLSVPESCALRDQFRSASFRAVGRVRQPISAVVQRSKTMRETTCTGREEEEVVTISQSFAKRYQMSQESPTVLSFMHDAFELQRSASGIHQVEAKKTTSEMAVQAGYQPAPREPVKPEAVRPADKIVLRVESFRMMPQRNMNESRAIRNVKRCERVSSGTQTDLSVLKQRAATMAPGRARQSHALGAAANPPKPPGNLNLQYRLEKNSQRGDELQRSPVESSSGYSSPRDPESKSPTPEPFRGDPDGPSDAVNVTVIQIDPKPRKSEVTYAVPKKKHERGLPVVSRLSASDDADADELNYPDVKVSVNTKPVTRSVSMHHTFSRRAATSDWRYMSPAAVVSIPRPILRNHSRRNPSPYLRRRHMHPAVEPRTRGLNRSSSLHVAMSEIQEKLNTIQLYGNFPTDLAPVHAYGAVRHLRQEDDDDEDEMDSYERYYDTQQRRTLEGPCTPPESPDESQRGETLEASRTLAYLSELELLARHWRTQLMYQVEMKQAHRMAALERDSFEC